MFSVSDPCVIGFYRGMAITSQSDLADQPEGSYVSTVYPAWVAASMLENMLGATQADLRLAAKVKAVARPLTEEELEEIGNKVVARLNNLPHMEVGEVEDVEEVVNIFFEVVDFLSVAGEREAVTEVVRLAMENAQKGLFSPAAVQAAAIAERATDRRILGIVKEVINNN